MYLLCKKNVEDRRKSKKMKKYNASLDWLKGFSCLMVVVIHMPFPGIAGNMFSRLGDFAVPIFLLISGFYAEGNNKEQAASHLIKKAMHIFKLFIIAILIYLGIYILRNGWSETIRLPFIGKFLCLNDYNAIGAYHLWFLPALAWLYFVHATICKLKFKVHEEAIFAILIIMMLLWGWHEKTVYIENFLYPGMLMYLLGCIIKKRREKMLKIPDAILGVIIIVGLIFFEGYVWIREYSGLDIYGARIDRVLIYVVAFAAFVYALKHPIPKRGGAGWYISEKIFQW